MTKNFFPPNERPVVFAEMWCVKSPLRFIQGQLPKSEQVSKLFFLKGEGQKCMQGVPFPPKWD
jgi:hypothetical protein